MASRTPQYYRDRPSVVVVSETRGTPLKMLSLLVSIMWGLVGLRNFFFCDIPLSGTDSEREQIHKMYYDCKNDKTGQFTADLVGIFSIMQSAIRFHMATTTHVADLYLTLLLLTGIDALIFLAMIRYGWDANPWYYNIMAAGSFLYEGYTLVQARQAHLARLKMKES